MRVRAAPDSGRKRALAGGWRRAGGLLVPALLTLLAAAPPAWAKLHAEVRAGYYLDAKEGMIGGGAYLPVSQRWDVNPNLEWVFVGGFDYYNLNLDVHRDLSNGTGPSLWLGAGPTLIVVDVNDALRIRDRNRTHLGLNLLAGVGGRRGSLIPFAQFKLALSDDSEASLAAGVRF